MVKKGKKPWKKSGPASGALTKMNKMFRAPIIGYEYVFFTSGTSKDSAQFMDTIEQLSTYVAMLGWKQALALAKVMTKLKDLALVAPANLTRTYVCGSGPNVVKKTNQITLGEVNIPMDDDIDYQDTMYEYLIKKRRYNAQLENWEDNNAKDTTLCCSTVQRSSRQSCVTKTPERQQRTRGASLRSYSLSRTCPSTR